jgi:hypothetical protein
MVDLPLKILLMGSRVQRSGFWVQGCADISEHRNPEHSELGHSGADNGGATVQFSAFFHFLLPVVFFG